MRLFYAELLKIRTAHWTAVTLVLALLALVGLGAAGTSSEASGSLDVTQDIVDIGGLATIFALILGILVVTWDYRHGTITQTFLAVPRRELVYAAKLATVVVLGAALVVLALALSLLIAQVWIGDMLSLTDEHWKQAGRIIVAAVLWAVLGLGLGATLQTQVGALIAALIWFLVVENILVSLGDIVWGIGDYLPGQALTRFASADPGEGYGRPAAALIAAGYALGAAAIGLVSVLRRDVG